MRISKNSIETLTALSRKYFGDAAPLRLFGSRLDDQARGGDIDLQIIAPHATFRDEIALTHGVLLNG